MSHIQYLEKTAQMAMNMNLILQQKIAALRAENEHKKKKKARRQATLESSIILNIQKDHDRVEQLDKQLDKQLNEQLNEPTPAPRQRAPPRCSSCNTIGHTIECVLISSYLFYLLYNLFKVFVVEKLENFERARIRGSVVDYVIKHCFRHYIYKHHNGALIMKFTCI
jgi:hypothetical protein